MNRFFTVKEAFRDIHRTYKLGKFIRIQHAIFQIQFVQSINPCYKLYFGGFFYGDIQDGH